MTNKIEKTKAALGLEHGIVRLVDHNPLWSILYDEESTKILNALGSRIIDIHHIGSTSIPGIKAKPILDIMVGIEVFNEGPFLEPFLVSLGYDYVPHADVPHDHIYGKSQPRTHLLHVVKYKGKTWENQLRFRNALRSDLELAKEYEEIKVQLCSVHGDSRATYTEKKGVFIERVLAKNADASKGER